MAWIGVITNAGEDAIEECLASGTPLNLNSVKTGSGIVADSGMRALTDVDTAKDTGNVMERKAVSTGIRVVVSIGPSSAAYTLHEVGLFATLGEGAGATNVMIAYFKDTDGVSIPKASDFPDFCVTLSSILDMANNDDFTITVDPNAYVPYSVLSSYLDDKLDIDQGIANAGKFMMVDENGEIAPVAIELASGGEY